MINCSFVTMKKRKISQFFGSGNDREDLHEDETDEVDLVESPQPSASSSRAVRVPPPDWCRHTTSSKPEWVGFWRSEKGDNQRRFKAMCSWCGETSNGILEVLRKHKLKCTLMDEETKSMVSNESVKKNPAPLKTLPQVIGDNTHRDVYHNS